MTRGEKSAFGVAAAGHVVLFGLLSVGFLSSSEPMSFKSKSINVSLVDEVALHSAAPATATDPAPSLAPEIGAPSDAPPPSVSDAPSDLAPAEAARQPDSSPAPAPAKKPAPDKPATSKPAKSSRSDSAPKRESKPETTKSRGSDSSAKSKKPRGSRLGDDFLKGVVDSGKGKSTTPRAEQVSARAVASLGDAIQRQVQPCANRIPNPGPGANRIRSKIRLQMQRDGTLAARPSLRGQSGVDNENRRYARRVAELAMSAIIGCAPYDLPDELYKGGWQDIIINYKLPG